MCFPPTAVSTLNAARAIFAPLGAYLKKVEQHGGTTVVPPTEIPQFNLTFAVIADPEGHVVKLSKGAA